MWKKKWFCWDAAFGNCGCLVYDQENLAENAGIDLSQPIRMEDGHGNPESDTLGVWPERYGCGRVSRLTSAGMKRRKRYESP